jgi:hypothetical protein
MHMMTLIHAQQWHWQMVAVTTSTNMSRVNTRVDVLPQQPYYYVQWYHSQL